MKIKQAQSLAFLVLLDSSIHDNVCTAFADNTTLSILLSCSLRSLQLLPLECENIVSAPPRVLHEVVWIRGESLILLFFRTLLVLCMCDALLDASEREKALNRGTVIRLDKVLVIVEYDLGLAVGAAVQTNELDDRLGDLQILAEAQKNALDDSVGETYTGSRVE